MRKSEKRSAVLSLPLYATDWRPAKLNSTPFVEE